MAVPIDPARLRKGPRPFLRDIARKLKLLELPPDELRPPARQVREHPKRQRLALEASIRQRGFIVPVMVTEDNVIFDGVLRLEIAKAFGLATIPAICVADVGLAERKLLSIALNRIPDLAIWDDDNVVLEFRDLLGAVDLDFTVEASGYSTAELDVIFDAVATVPMEDDELGAGAALVDPMRPVVSRLGDLWLIGAGHRLLCGNARDAAAYLILFGDERARMACTDPPYNVKIGGHVSGLGKHTHREFIEASGEMSSAEFQAFLAEALTAMTTVCVDGAIVMTAMDWRHMKELAAAGEAAGLALNNLCVWTKTNGGMGSLYRSQHELFFIWKFGAAPHVNNVMLGAEGRYRTNVWTAAGQNSFGGQRDEELALHPSVKPVSLIAEAIRDVSHHGEIVLDPFCGSGTVLLAAEKTDRRACAMELDPAYVDVALRRYLGFRPDARITLAATGETFAEVEARRLSAGDFDDEPALLDSAWEIV
jgi:DNA modification methylase